ncbi:MAG: OmpA family protein, partial [Cyclobacteriaceae bacterium]|nr:OmpA family protein [Cyclobacteriaceae bacterium]
GDKQAYHFSYSEAITSYESALENDKENDRIRLKIAESYRKLNDPENAAKWYAQVIDNGEVVETDHYLHYAETLSNLGKYEEARKWYDQYEISAGGNTMAKRKIEAIDNIHTLFADSGLYEISKLGVNTSYADFSPAFYQDGLVFVSSRPNKSNKKIDFNWDQSKFLELYFCRESEEGFVEEPEPFNRKLNTKYHEGPLVFFENDTKMIFTRNNYLSGKYGESSDGVNKLKLFYTEKVEQKWEKPVPLPFNDDEYSVGHPTISSDGKVLIFSSDMPGSIGNTDLYISRFQNGEWSNPENMGNKINTKGREMFPFLYDDHILFFASTGHAGLGGLDIYEIDLELIGTTEVKNLGYPINSHDDDFGLVLNREMTSGYFSSNRKNKPSNDDIYQLVFRSFIGEIIVLDGDTKEPIEEVVVSVREEITNATQYLSDHTGKVTGLMSLDKDYEMVFAKADYEETSLTDYRIEPNNFPLKVYMYREGAPRLLPDSFPDHLVAGNDENQEEHEKETGSFPLEQQEISNAEQKAVATKDNRETYQDKENIKPERNSLSAGENKFSTVSSEGKGEKTGNNPSGPTALSIPEKNEEFIGEKDDSGHASRSGDNSPGTRESNLTDSSNEDLGKTTEKETLEQVATTVPGNSGEEEFTASNSKATIPLPESIGKEEEMKREKIDNEKDGLVSETLVREIKEAEVKDFVAEKSTLSSYKTILLDIIYYDFNEHFIRDDAREVLDKISRVFIEHPKAKILISSHTDIRGAESYNKNLSMKRAVAALNYLLKHEEITKDRFVIQYFGESNLAEPCDGSPGCSEEQHQLNRRSEFILLLDK